MTRAIFIIHMWHSGMRSSDMRRFCSGTRMEFCNSDWRLIRQLEKLIESEGKQRIKTDFLQLIRRKNLSGGKEKVV